MSGWRTNRGTSLQTLKHRLCARNVTHLSATPGLRIEQLRSAKHPKYETFVQCGPSITSQTPHNPANQVEHTREDTSLPSTVVLLCICVVIPRRQGLEVAICNALLDGTGNMFALRKRVSFDLMEMNYILEEPLTAAIFNGDGARTEGKVDHTVTMRLPYPNMCKGTYWSGKEPRRDGLEACDQRLATFPLMEIRLIPKLNNSAAGFGLI
ncbi:hypothetical protein K438DRAFT_1762181 [Mycena galopus ATCC 62051]|nr:hypothetical protein K438DRAFT_1762181 [Mycena galopus ATCC 62051]